MLCDRAVWLNKGKIQASGVANEVCDAYIGSVHVEQTHEAGAGVARRGTGEATITLMVQGQERLCVAEGDGPVHALDGALRSALLEFYPELAQIKLTDFKVRVIDSAEGVAAKVRVIVTSGDGSQEWSTIGVSTNVIEASWFALLDSVIYGLQRNRK